MKTARAIFAAGGVSLALAMAAAAEDTPETRPHVAPPPAADASIDDVPMSFIGIATSVAPPALREQLRLPHGVGLLVEFVEKDSPAEAAGLRPHDVIHKFNDQLTINAQQLSVLVRLQKPGERIVLSVIRGGDSREIPVTLGGRASASFARIPPASANDGDDAPIPRAGIGHASHAIRHIDAEHDITIVTHDDESLATVKDRSGTVLYKCRLDREDELNQLPDAVRKKVMDLEQKSAKLRRLPPAGIDDDL